MREIITGLARSTRSRNSEWTSKEDEIAGGMTGSGQKGVGEKSREETRCSVVGVVGSVPAAGTGADGLFSEGERAPKKGVESDCLGS